MNYPYASIQLIDGEIKAVVNKEAEPKIIQPSKITTLIFYFIYDLWQQKHEVFEFANPHEEGKIMRHIGGMNPKIKYAIEVTCIEIKDGRGWFKEEKEEDEVKIIIEIIRKYPIDIAKIKINNKFKIIRK